MTDKELMQMALDALEWCYDVTEWPANGESTQDKAIEALRARLAQPEPTLALWNFKHNRLAGLSDDRAEVVLIRQREWQGLTEDEVAQAMYRADAIFTGPMQFKFAKEIEAALKAKNA